MTSPDLETILGQIRNGEAPHHDERDTERVETDLFEKLRQARVQFEGEILALYHFMCDPKAPAAAKGVAVAALLYFVMPIDVVPDWIPLVGFTDDAAVVTAAVAWLGPLLAPYRAAAKGHARARAERRARH